MSTEQVLVATLVVGVIVAVGTVILVLYTPFGQDLRKACRWVVAGILNVKRGVGIAARAVVRSLQTRRPFWLTLMLLIVGWTLAALVRGDISLTRASTTDMVLLFIAGLGSVCALALAFIGPVAHPQAVQTKEPNDQQSKEDVARAKRFGQLHQQLWAAASAIKKYADPGGYTESEQVKPVNNLIYMLLAEGEDVTTFVIPSGWMTSANVENRLLLPRLEGLLIYLNQVDVMNRLLQAGVRSLTPPPS